MVSLPLKSVVLGNRCEILAYKKPVVYGGVNFVQKNCVTTFLNDHLPLEAGGFVLHFHVCLPSASSFPSSCL